MHDPERLPETEAGERPVFPDEIPTQPPRAASEAESNPLPTQIDRYRIERMLGKGGFGRVYLGYDEELKRKVALKIPRADRVARPTDVEEYLVEARILARLDHPAIVPVHDVGRTDDGLCYVVSKFIEGTDLQVRLQHERLSNHESATLVATVAEALHYAHNQGLVHRDIKPANILIDLEGKPYVADFGLALKEEDLGSGPSWAGTPCYMSPEQARGEGHLVDGRSDIFSLGVVFYELLTGKRPFRADSQQELLQQVSTVDVRPPRQRDDRIPKELERICLKALSKKASDRYTIARDLADDLRHFLAESPPSDSQTHRATSATHLSTVQDAPLSTDTPTSSASLASQSQLIRIIPKGLRSFDAKDADFFLELLPGPRDRAGLPDTIRFWKDRVEEKDADETFRVGLIYGPSGCGKSSMLKAGLLPRLSKDVVAVYVEATPDETESRLLQGLRKQCPALPENLSLKETLANLRRGQGIASDKKVLIILDQFEQWLHAKLEDVDPELVGALRQCDGSNVQAIVMVRDDFWMAATRFMRELEVRLLEGQNSNAVDLFPIRHARRVLTAFGRAYGELPPSSKEQSQDQTDFIEQAVDGLADEGKVISVRLALFAEMMKGKAWTPAALKEVGGTTGIGVNFLEETFSASTAPPEYRYHQNAARAVLKALLPDSGTDIKGHMRSSEELLEASGYARRPREFQNLINILDSEIRLVTPTDPLGERLNDGLLNDSQATGDSGETYFQLTHDYLVPSLRQWLTRKQRETFKGRAELRLAERASLWSAKLENRHLPAWWEYLSIACLTSRKGWTAPQQKMMRKAGRLHGLRAVAALVALALCAAGGVRLRQSIQEARRLVEQEAREKERAARAEELVKSLQYADIGMVGAIVKQLESFHSLSIPLLRQHEQEAEYGSSQKLNLSLGLLGSDPAQAEYLFEQLLQADAGAFPVIRDFLAAEKDRYVTQLWQLLDDPRGDSADQQLRAAAALATYDPENPRWQTVRPRVAMELASVPVSFLNEWKEAFRPISTILLDPLTEIYRDDEMDGIARSLAASLLADYASQDVKKLADLVSIADQKQFAVIYPILARREAEAVGELRSILERRIESTWNDDPLDPGWEPVPAAMIEAIEAGDGVLDDRFAFCQTMPLQQCVATAEALRASGFRPIHLRPFAHGDAVRSAAIWTRDAQPWRMEYGLTAQRIGDKDQEFRELGLIPIDVAGYVDHDEEGQPVKRFSAIWAASAELDCDVQMYVGVPVSTERLLYTDSLTKEEYNRRVYSAFVSHDDLEYRSAIWMKSKDQEGSTSRIFTGPSSQFTGEIFPGLLLDDVNVSPAVERQDSQQRYSEQLAALESLLADQPDDVDIRKKIAVVRFQLRQDELALEDVNWLIEQEPEASRFYQFRSVLHARAQRAEESRQDQERFEELYADSTQHHYLDAIISAHLDDDEAGMQRLEDAIEQNPDNGLMFYNAACAYALCSDIVAARDTAKATAYVDRAAVLLREAIEAGYDNFPSMQQDSDLDALLENVDVQQLIDPHKSESRYIAVWNVSTTFESKELHGLAPEPHMRVCRALIADGYRPKAMSIGKSTDGKALESASVWHRPRVRDSDKDLLAKQQSKAAAALLRMAQEETVWPLLKHSPDPRTRSYLIHHLSPLNCNPETIISRMQGEPDLSTRRALILALGEYDQQQLPAPLREQLAAELLDQYSADPDPGIHGAAEWVLRQWGKQELLKQADLQLAIAKPDGDRRWYLNKQGQTLVMIPGPVKFLMGTPVDVVGREGGPGGQMETLHRKRIGRSFAIMSHEVTVDEYLRFVPDFTYSKFYAREGDAPMTRITWYAAAEYCNWLSEQDGLPQDQWCYLPNDDGEFTVGMKPAPDYLERTGYRLPTGAEWEYACGAGAMTSRYFGEAEDLLVEYVWCKKNSEDRWMRPVASMKPNDLGLFDMQGNAWEWCHEVSHFFKISMTGGWSEDLPDTAVANNSQLRVLRGGSFLSQPEDVRTSRRYRYQPSFRNYSVGMRAAKTYRAE